MFKKIGFLLLLLLLVNTAYSKEYDIAGHKFNVKNVEFIQEDMASIDINGVGNVVIERDKLDLYVLENLANVSKLEDFYNVCNKDCLSDIFSYALKNSKFDIASFSYLMLANIDDNEEVMKSQDLLLLEENQENFIEFCDNLLNIKVPQEVLNNKTVKEKLTKHFLQALIYDSNWTNNKVFKFLLDNIHTVDECFNKLFYEYNLTDNAISKIDNLIKIQERVFGFSSTIHQKNFTDFEQIKFLLNEIENISNADELTKINVLYYKKSKFFELLQDKYIKKIYFLASESLKNKQYDKAFDAILLIPSNKINETALNTLKEIFDNADNNYNFLSDVNLERLSVVLNNNDWLRQKVIKFQEKHVKNLVSSKNEFEILRAFDVLIKLRPDVNIKNDNIRILISWNALKNGNKDLSKQILAGIGNNFVYLLSFKGIFLFCKNFLWIFFGVIAITIMAYVFIFKLKHKLESTKAHNAKETHNKTTPKDEQDSSEMEKYRSLLKYFNLPRGTTSIKAIKSAYRKRIKLIHPDILGKETSEFLEVQEKYKEITHLHGKLFK